LIIESQPTGTQYNIYSRNNGAGVNLRLQTTTAMQPNNTVFTIEDVAGLTHFNIRQNGDVFANNGYKPGGGTWADVSDARTKEDILDYQTGLASVRQLRPVSFKHNGKGGTVADNRTFVGLLAHEAQLVMPEMVSVTAAKLDPDDAAPTELLSLDATALLYALVNAVQELATKMDAVDVPA
jgi:hypothetical protein